MGGRLPPEFPYDPSMLRDSSLGDSRRWWNKIRFKVGRSGFKCRVCCSRRAVLSEALCGSELQFLLGQGTAPRVVWGSRLCM